MSLEYHLSLVDARPYALVLNDLRRRHPLREIASASGLSRFELTEISRGRRLRIRQGTADRLRAAMVSLYETA